MAEEKMNLRRCEMCDREYQSAPHRYDGKVIRKLRLEVCATCYAGNEDGWAPHLESRLLDHLKEKGLPVPERNSNGLIPRDG